MNITQEQWEKACKRAGIHARSGPMHVAHRRSDMPPIGDPAAVLKMLEVGHFHLLPPNYWEPGEVLHSDQWHAFISERHKTGLRAEGFGDTPAEAIVHAVLALPEATDG